MNIRNLVHFGHSCLSEANHEIEHDSSADSYTFFHSKNGGLRDILKDNDKE